MKQHRILLFLLLYGDTPLPAERKHVIPVHISVVIMEDTDHPAEFHIQTEPPGKNFAYFYNPEGMFKTGRFFPVLHDFLKSYIIHALLCTFSHQL